jgi:hypothetical protein
MISLVVRSQVGSIPGVLIFFIRLGYWAAENSASPRRGDKAVS